MDIGTWRIEVSATPPAQHEEYLHFVAVTDDGQTPITAQQIKANSGTAARVGNLTVLFAVDGATEITVQAPGEQRLLVVGLEPSGRYDVTLSGSDTILTKTANGPQVASSQGVLYLSRGLDPDGDAGGLVSDGGDSPGAGKSSDGCSCGLIRGSAMSSQAAWLASVFFGLLAVVRRRGGAVS